MGTKIVYTGGPQKWDSVEVAGVGIAEKGKVIEVETELAKQLLEQEDNWQRPSSSSK